MSEEHRVEAGGIQWRVVIHGQGPTFLAVHGTGSSSHSFAPLADELAYTVIAPDLPGHDRSGPGPRIGAALPAFAAGLAALLDRLDRRPEVALGHSAGAAVVAWMAREGWITPRLCVGVGAAFVPFEGRRQTFARFSARLLARSGAGRGLARLAPLMSRLASAEGLPAAQAERYRQLAADPDHVQGVLDMLARWDPGPLFETLDQVPGRWLLLSGSHDSVVPIGHQRLAASRLGDARVASIPGGHLIHEVNPERVASEISRELAGSSLFV